MPAKSSPPASPSRPTTLRSAWPLVASALLLFTANPGGPTLAPLDDCFYARKAAEMAEHPGMTVTWAGQPAFQNPPGQIWIMAASFRLLGTNDAAARLPSALMATGAIAMTAWIGARLLSPAAGLTGAALLAVSPFFLNNGRRAMLEIPSLFWTLLAMAALVAWRRRPAAVFLFAPALAMALLTKSVLGLMPLFVTLTAALLLPAWRRLFRDERFWLAAALGLLIGASWTAHQWWVHGAAFLDVHFAREIAGRSLRKLSLLRRVGGYPAILLSQFQPVVLLAVAGAWRLSRTGPGGAATLAPPRAEFLPAEGSWRLLLAWTLLPIGVAVVSSAQSARYLFTSFPALALLGGFWLAARWPRAARVLATRIVPAALLCGALIFWARPGWLSRQGDEALRDHSDFISTRVPAGRSLPYWGADYWRVANPVFWYTGRQLEASAPTAAEAIERARSANGLLVCERSRLGALPAGFAATALIEARDAVVLELNAVRP